MDIEEYVIRCLSNNVDESKIIEDGFKRIMEIKNIDEKIAKEFIRAVLEEVKTTMSFKDSGDENLIKILDYPKSGVKMGEIGGGSRGEGDFFIHKMIGEIIKSTNQKTVVDSREQDDGGVVEGGGKYIVVAIDGTHSRLSNFPFLAGFHVARACLRDIYVMGARPVALISDIHLSDDGDVGKIFDFTSGVCTISQSLNVPLISGSTLRVGGDMVLGERMVSSVGAIGVIDENQPTARRRCEVGDVIIMTEGSGGGTISTTALYYGMFDVIYETLNVDFLKSCDNIIKNNLLEYIHVMTDITNGGLRGDAYEISKTANVSLEFDKKSVIGLINPKVLDMLNKLNIDPLGVSIGSLMIICPEEHSEEIIKNTGGKIVGRVKEGNISYIVDGNKREKLIPKFREAPYTPVKKVVDKIKPTKEEFELMKKKVEQSCKESIKKKDFVLDLLKNRNKI